MKTTTTIKAGQGCPEKDKDGNPLVRSKSAGCNEIGECGCVYKKP